ncbi:MAG: FecR domain-containing protein, partial [Bryobacterales bacterium]|nr:FecR domain-containing protein [Bryobacterales bacterium]
MRRFSLGLVVMAIMMIALPLGAQDAISAKAGLVNYFEGTVLMNGEELKYSATRFHQIPNGGILETPANGRAEVLLSPGVMLWLGESSRLELVSDKLDAAQVRLLGGNAVISSTEFPKETSITILVNDDQVRFSNAGVYRLSFSPTKLEVQEGQADVLRAGVETRVKKGRSLMIDQPGSSLARID